MTDITEIERQLLRLSAPQREQLAIRAWESLLEDPDAASDSRIDPEGIELAAARDRELDTGAVKPLDQREFRRRTGGGE